MDERMIEKIRLQMQEKSIKELLEIWNDYNQEEWTDEAFEAVRRVLVSRGEQPAPHLPAEAQAKKIQKPDWQAARWNWLDWLNLMIIFLIIEFALIPAMGGDFAFRTIIRFGWGIFLAMVYYLTLRRLWIRKFPHLYQISRERQCSKCRTPIREDAVKCPKCGAAFAKKNE